MEYEITSNLRGIERGWILIRGEKVDGKKCNTCGIMKPLTEYTPNKQLYDGHINKCKSCSAERQRRYVKERPDIRRKAERKWREKNPDKVKEMAKRSRKKNMEGYRRRLRDWREKNPERNKEIQRNYVKNNPESVKESKRKWREANKNKIRIYSLNRRTRLNELPNNFDEEWANIILEIYGGCVLTGEKEDLHWDHFIPVSKGGGTTYGNMIPLKSSINIRKSNKNPIDFFIEEGMSYERLYDILWFMAYFNDLTISEYIEQVYEAYKRKEEG